MDSLIRSYLEQAKLNGESWESDEDPNDVIDAQDLLDYFDGLVKRATEVTRELEACRTDFRSLDKQTRRGFEETVGYRINSINILLGDEKEGWL